jgi:hypothetical protein
MVSIVPPYGWQDITGIRLDNFALASNNLPLCKQKVLPFRKEENLKWD